MLARRFLLIALLASMPYASAADGIALQPDAASGDHGHSTSLTIEHGELHVVLHHHGERESGAAAIDDVDHEMHLRETAIGLPSTRQRDQAPVTLMSPMDARTDALPRVAAHRVRFETPRRVVLPSATSILRI
ncbi:MAG: hypothetical protein ABIP63_05225 [Thermoanaerobaculia bacterium]